MESLGLVEKFIIGYIQHENFGRIYIMTSTDESPEKTVAKLIADEIAADDKVKIKITPKIEAALKKLQEYWMIQVSGYEVKFTSYGQQVAKELDKQTYLKIKQQISQGKL